MPTGADTLTITAQQRSALRTLVYFDLFHHPLRPEEVVRFADSSMSDDGILGDLVEQQLVRSIDGYLLMNNNTGMLDQRRTDEVRAQARMGKARRMSRLIGAFPFVRGVLLSGSMSKGRLASDGDIDYFVITRPGRLWIARTLLVLFKKVFLLNSRRYFCVNYFVDEDHLTIEDRNRFTATELVTLIPTNGKAACAAFFAANDWAFDRFPQAGIPDLPIGPDKAPWMKRSVEVLLSGAPGTWLDTFCMRITLKRWRRKFGRMPEGDFAVAFRSRRYVSKHHPNHFQGRVMKAYQERLERFATRHGIDLEQA